MPPTIRADKVADFLDRRRIASDAQARVRANAASGAILETGREESPMERITLYHNPG